MIELHNNLILRIEIGDKLELQKYQKVWYESDKVMDRIDNENDEKRWK